MVERPFTVAGADATAPSDTFTPDAAELSGRQREPIFEIVAQHVDEVAHLRQMRSLFVRAPDKRLQQLARLDERLAAHFDGIRLAGSCGARLAHRALERPGASEVFVATVGAIEDRDANRLAKLLAVGEALSAAPRGLV